MRGAVLVAIAATIGNFLQGWDNSTIAGAVIYIKKEFHLETQPTVEGLIVAMSLVGGTMITTCSGPVADIFGRRPMLILSSLCYLIGSLVMLWSPNVYVLLVARLLDGFGIGLAVTLVPLYISETAPSEIRGTLNTLPQFLGSGGMFLSYIMVFMMSLQDSPNWRLMLGVLAIPSLFYLIVAVLFLPESPRWLVSKGKYDEAKAVLQRLRGRDDVAGEMALLLEGLGVGKDPSIEEYVIGPANDDVPIDHPVEKMGEVRLYGAEEGVSWVAKPATGQSSLGGVVSRQGSLANQNVPLMDPLVTLFGSVHENNNNFPAPTSSMMGSMFLPTSGSMLGMLFPGGGGGSRVEPPWDEEGQKDGTNSNTDQDEEDGNAAPLLSRPSAYGGGGGSSMFGVRRNSSLFAGGEEGGVGIGGGWQLAYKYPQGKKEGGLQRVYLHGGAAGNAAGSRRGSMLSGVGPALDVTAEEFMPAAALVSQTAVCSKEMLAGGKSGVSGGRKGAAAGGVLSALCEPGIKRALVVGVVLQFLQQISGINGVLYYTPQILQEAGVSVLLASLGLRSDSASILISLFSTIVMLPCIMLSMRIMDVAGRRSIMLYTIPILIVALFAIVFCSIVSIGDVPRAIISTGGVIIYMSGFVMGFGVIPNILCAEIFPTTVRGLCITACALTYWIMNIIVTYSSPLLMNNLGLAGVFTIYGIGCMVSWVFVFLKVPETKGMPLEVISEFFAAGASVLDRHN
ncbi:Monosaccharide-sensing protein 3 [Linum perenne]